MVIQCKNLISLYILPDQRRVRYFDFDQNRLCIYDTGCIVQFYSLSV